jgi:predicted enzyme related to lactoylglutathione lyase
MARRRMGLVLRLQHVTFSCEEPTRVADFWAALLDYETAAAGDSRLATDPRGEGTRLLFNRMPKSPTIELPIHLDVNVPDREAELARVLELGGRLVETKSHSVGDLEEKWTVMRDPEGNGFCIQSPPSALPHRYIGNVTFSCAEPQYLGRFWANALDWPDEEIDQGFLQQLRDAGMDERELTSFYATRPPDGGGPRFLFQRRERSRPASYPIHLDFATDDREAEVERLTRAGASVVETKAGTNIPFTVMRDPDGNPFCVG